MCRRFVGGLSVSQSRSIHIEARIKQLGHVLPKVPADPKGNYMTYIKYGTTIYLAGHLPQPAGGELMTGRLGETMNVEEGKLAARMAALQMMSSIKKACGDLDKVKKILKLTGYVNSTNDFTAQATVMNGCSDLFGEVFGVEVGRHSRSAIGVNVLPLGIPVENEGIIEIEE